MVDYGKVRDHTIVLKTMFEFIASLHDITAEELLELQAELVKRQGKYGNDYDGDWLAKLAFDYHFCVEMVDAMKQELWLSFPRRERLYRFATKNKDIKELWVQYPQLSANVFLDKEERKIEKIPNRRRYK